MQGAVIANDVWGLQRDPDMAELVAARHAPVIIMHNRDSADPDIDIMQDIADFFARSLDIADKAGISRDKIVLDPGIGFGKTPEQSMTALARLDEISIFGLPLLVGASRKRFISTVTPSEPHQRLGGSIAAHLIAAQGGARIIRTHDVAETVQALRVAAAIEGQAMTDTIFITGVVIHARHGVMEHETEVGQRFVIDLELVRRPVGILAHRPPRRYRVLFQRGGDRDGGLQECQLQAAGARGRRGRRRRYWRRFRASAPSRSPCTSRMRRSPRFSTMSAWS